MTVLVPMRPEVFADVMTASIAAYASDNVAAGRWPQAGELGVDSIGLHVFGFNAAAQALYGALGYTVTGINMNKPLRRPAD